MGEVYRATDTKLKRQVAVKILPPSLARDAERLARFRRPRFREESGMVPGCW
jgi:eukaryotic-like serine/threonine-protein kinase